MKNTQIPRKYLMSDKNKKVAVMLDIKTFEKIEDTLENYGLMQYVLENKNEDPMQVAEAKTYYSRLKKG